jgi:predicted nucleic acid-binding protein
LLDTNAFIYFLTGQEPYLSLLVPLFRRVQRGELTIIVSTITEAELLVRPERERDQDAIERIADLLSEDGFEVMAVDRRTARLAARLRGRARSKFGLPDAIIVATAVLTRCEAVVGNDGDWREISDIPIVHLGEVAKQR